MTHGSIMVSKYHLHVGGPGSIPTAATTITTATAAGDAEHVSLNHRLASLYQCLKLIPAKNRVGQH